MTAQQPAGSPLPSGDQVELTAGGQRAVVVEVGGGLREYTVHGQPVLDGYAADEMCSGGRGQTMIPWPNRVRDGRYAFAGTDLQLALSEVGRRNAIHGLTRWLPWRVLERSAARVVMGHRLHPQPGYPFALDARIEYDLTDDGLTARTTATNVGDRPCPYGTGAHPYLAPGAPGAATVDEAVLTAPGRRYLPTDDRGIPTGTEDVEGGPYDLRAGRSLAGLRLDHCFTDLARDATGRAEVRLRADRGRAVTLWLDDGYPYLQLFTGDSLPADRRRGGLAVEPMTCAPNAFATGDGLQVLEPGTSTTAAWGVRAG